MVLKLIGRARDHISDLQVEEVDVSANPEVAVKYRIMSTPAIAINGRLAFTGVPREADLRRAILSE